MKLVIVGTTLCLWVGLTTTAASGGRNDSDGKKANRVEGFLRGCYENGQFNGAALVAARGRVLYKGAFGYANFEWSVRNTPDTKFRIASISKTFLTIVMLQLVEQGKVDLERSVNYYLPGFSRKWGDRVSLRQILTYTSGLPDYNSIPDFFRQAQAGLMTDDKFLQRIAEHDLVFEPGTSFGYSSDGVNVLARLIEKVTGKPYAQVLKERVIEPAGLTDTGFARQEVVLEKRAAGYRKTLAGLENAPFYRAEPASGLYSTVEDLFRYNLALSSDKLLSVRHRELIWSISPHGNAYGWLNHKLTLPDPKEELLVLMTEGAVYGFYSRFLRLPRDDYFIALLTNVRSSRNYLPQIGEAVIRILYDRPYDLPKQALAPVLRDTIMRSGLNAALAQYRELKATDSTHYDFGEEELNSLGYYLLTGRRRLEEAITIFLLNAEEFPKSWNVFDSLAEAYLTAGNRDKASVYYKKSLELNPGNDNAKAMLKRIAEGK
jgi:CubicO group peptidase (beta-lactamase class C family)